MKIFGRTKEYRVSSDSDDWMTPEETLIDSSSAHSDIEKPITPRVFRVYFSVFAIATVLVMALTFNLAYLDHKYLNNLALQNKTANFPISAPRGIIYDRNNKPLVQNTPNFGLLIVSREIRNNQDLLEKNITATAAILAMPVDELRTLITERAKVDAIFFAFEDLTKDQALAIKFINPKGFYVVTDTKREYTDGQKLSSVLGYVGKVAKEDFSDPYYYPSDTIGRLGIEAQYEEALRGEHGNIFFTADTSNSQNKDAIVGSSVVLNIDRDIQAHLYDSLREVLAESNLSRAAAIVQNPKNGQVLGLVSFPAYDNNVFSSQVSELDFSRLFQSKAKPLFNRIISGQYNPGSTIKPFMGLAALQEKTITPADTIQDCLEIDIGDAKFRNWRPDYGLFNLRRSIANSCNVYFFSIGGGYGHIRGLGITRIADYLKRGLADSRLGIDLPGEAKGFVPDPAWKLKARGESWYLGDTFNVSIGQGDLSVTPLWLNTYISAIANGGTMYQPQVANRIVGLNGKTIQSFNPQEVGKMPFSQANLAEMRSDMKETVISGTAHLFSDLPVAVAAKTGTAEVVKGQSINALFTSFAPADNAEIAITVLVEGSASNQGYAIRAAHAFMKWYFEERGK